MTSIFMSISTRLQDKVHINFLIKTSLGLKTLVYKIIVASFISSLKNLFVVAANHENDTCFWKELVMGLARCDHHICDIICHIRRFRNN